MQRLHQHDLVGHVQELSSGWTVLSLPAVAETEHRVQIGPDRWRVRRVGELLHPEREPLAALDEIKASLGSDIFSAQCQRVPYVRRAHLGHGSSAIDPRAIVSTEQQPLCHRRPYAAWQALALTTIVYVWRDQCAIGKVNLLILVPANL